MGPGRDDSFYYSFVKKLSVLCLFSFLLVVGHNANAQEPSSQYLAARNPDSSVDGVKKPKEKGIHVIKHGGSIGFFGSLIPKAWGQMYEPDYHVDIFSDYYETYDWGVTGGIGVFGEYQVLRLLTIGLELSVSFPRKKIIGYPGEDIRTCNECRLNFLFQILTTWKMPMDLYKNRVTIYPAVYLGYAGYIARFERGHMWIDHAMLSYQGFGFGWGIGLEFLTWYNAIFLEVRWMAYNLWHHRVDYNVWMGIYEETKEIMAYYGPVILVGLKFP